MNNSWYHRPFRIAALQCNFEKGRTMAVADRWKRMGFNVEQVFHPMADGYSALFNLKQHGTLLKAYLRRLKKNHIRAILYLNVHVLGPSLEKHKQDWAQRNAAGGCELFYYTCLPCCINSPWRDYYFQSLESLAAFDIDGVFLDGPVFIPGGCHCRHCRARYRRETGRSMAKNTDLAEFCRRSINDFLGESYRRFKRIKPGGIHYMNMPAMHPAAAHIRLPETLATNDIVGTEGGFQFYGPAKNVPLFKPSLTARILEALAPEKPRVIFMAADQKSWCWYIHTPVETKLCIAGTVANGSNLWYGIHGSTGLLDTPGGRAGAGMIRFLARHEDVFAGAVSEATVGLMYSYVTERSYRTSREPSDFYGHDPDNQPAGLGDFHAAFEGLGDMLLRASIPFDAVTDLALSLEKLKRYDCLILPTSACLDQKSVAVIREYAAQGGNLISSFDTSLFDENGRVQKNFALADVFGVSFTGITLKLKNFNYFKKTCHHPIWEGVNVPFCPAPSFGLGVKLIGRAQALGMFLEPIRGPFGLLEQSHLPALVLNRYGKGRSLYLAGSFGEMAASYNPPEYQQLLENALKLFVKQPVSLEGAMGNVELVVRKQVRRAGLGDRLVVHLINQAGLPPRPYLKVYPQVNLMLRIRNNNRFRRARALAAGCDCKMRREAADQVIILPVLNEYEIVVLE